MTHKKPLPLIPGPVHGRCPVCGEISYSRAGVHPQCAVRQADEKRMDLRKHHKPAPQIATSATSAKPWQRVCPKCGTLQHVRKQVCGCGCTLSVSMRRKSTDHQ